MSGDGSRLAEAAEEDGVNLNEVRKVGRHAFWTGQKAEFMWAPGDVVYWRPFDDGVHLHSWQSQLADQDVPSTGWYHAGPCECEYCAAIGY
jgi:hypothetical protein